MVGPGEWLFSLGILIGPIVIFIPILFSAFMPLGRFLQKQFAERSPLTWQVAVYGVAALATLVTFTVNVSWVWRATFMLGMLMVAYGNFTIIRFVWQNYQFVPVRECLSFLMFVSLVVYMCGNTYAMYFAGRQCSIATKEGKFERGNFLRFIGEGYLIGMGGRVFFVAKDQVTEIVCGDWPKKK